MGLGLNVAPFIMQAIVQATLSKDDAIWLATSAYIDVFINENIASATRVRQYLTNFGLASKELEWLQNGVRVLGLTVRGDGNTLIWERGPEHATHSYLAQCVLILWKASQALPSG